MIERSPRPNQINASGNSAMAGNGLKAEVSVSSRSFPSRDIMAKLVKMMASSSPSPVALQQQRYRVQHLLWDLASRKSGGERLQRGGECRHQQCVVEVAGIELPACRYHHQHQAFLSQPWLPRRCHNVSGACTTPMSWPGITSREYSGRVGGSPECGLGNSTDTSHAGSPPAPRCDRQTEPRGCGRIACGRWRDRRDRPRCC